MGSQGRRTSHNAACHGLDIRAATPGIAPVLVARFGSYRPGNRQRGGWPLFRRQLWNWRQSEDETNRTGPAFRNVRPCRGLDNNSARGSDRSMRRFPGGRFNNPPGRFTRNQSHSGIWTSQRWPSHRTEAGWMRAPDRICGVRAPAWQVIRETPRDQRGGTCGSVFGPGDSQSGAEINNTVAFYYPHADNLW